MRSRRNAVFWKSDATPISIPAELHDKLARTSRPIEQVDSEVIAVRFVPKHQLKDEENVSSYQKYLGAGA
jgi:hypothetical protein